jgi:hypothetical protein
MGNELDHSIEAGKQDAKRFIENERIDYEPFVALSDMHLVRKTVPVDYGSFEKTVQERDSDLWQEIDASRRKLAEGAGEAFNSDGYAAGFVETVAAVWGNIRDEVLKERW